jgi:hypothetical protein
MFNKLILRFTPYVNNTSKVLFLCALSVSFVFRIIYPNIYHHFDVTTFVSWGPFLNPIQQVYMTDCYCNYPIVGMLLSTGILEFFDYHIFSFLIFLCFIDAINVVLIWALLRLLNIRYALLWSGLIGLSFSSWIGGAQWGQIDNIGQLFLYLILILCYFFFKAEKKEANTFNLNILIIGLFISIAFLTKQLLLFPLVPIIIFLIFHFLFYAHSSLRFTYFFSLAFSILFPVFLFDLWLEIPEKYFFSHVERIFDTGSEHINFISGNGFNIWLTFFPDQNVSSTNPFFFGLSPKIIGLMLFVFGNLWMIMQLFHLFKKGPQDFKFIFVNLVGYFAFYNLLFNVVLTGTHERYLYHFYPYLIVFLLYLYFNHKQSIKFIELDLLVAFFGASLYGFFVFCILMKYLDNLVYHRILMVIHLLLLVRLIILMRHLLKQL